MSEGMSAESTSSWYDDAPITEQQIDAIRRSLDHPNSRVGSPFAPFVVRKLLAEVDRLRAHLAAERLATEAAETENDRLRARLDEIGETREEWGVQSQDSGRAQVADDEAHARHLADRYSRFRLPGGEPVQHCVVKRQASEWREVPDA